VNHLQAMRDRCVETFNSIQGFRCIAPQGCYVAWVDMQATGMQAEGLHKKLLDEARVAVVPGLPQWFGAGAEGHFRVSFASSSEIIEEALKRIKNAMV
jgi:aspartate/methionine/tyrosine aminotransferase